MSGFDCEFVETPPNWLEVNCPICLLVLCEPHQVTCCGKSFCKDCIKKIKARSQPCPTCKEDEFESFPNKGLQQPLYGFAVFCSNKERGCVWKGELGQLDQHINSTPDKEVGCEYTNIVCLFCDKLHPRHEMEQHQASLCPKRPFNCSTCEEYESTYEDVVNSHAPVCKCRPVECPNSCGADNLQHQHLEEHVSSQCPLTYVECEFSDAGCDAKVYRKNLASHLSDNLVTHMSLLAMENRKLKMELKKQEEKASTENRELKQQLWKQSVILSRHHKEIELQNEELEFLQSKVMTYQVPPLTIVCPASIIHDGGIWSTEDFYSHTSGYKLALTIISLFGSEDCFVELSLVESEFQVKPFRTIKLTIVIVSSDHTQRLCMERTLYWDMTKSAGFEYVDLVPYVVNSQLLFRVVDVSVRY